MNGRRSAVILTNRTLSIENPTEKVSGYDLAIKDDHVVLHRLHTGRRKNKGHMLQKRGLKPPPECGCEYKKIKTIAHIVVDQSASTGWYKIITQSYDKHNAMDEILGHGHLKKIYRIPSLFTVHRSTYSYLIKLSLSL